MADVNLECFIALETDSATRSDNRDRHFRFSPAFTVTILRGEFAGKNCLTFDR